MGLYLYSGELEVARNLVLQTSRWLILFTLACRRPAKAAYPVRDFEGCSLNQWRLDIPFHCEMLPVRKGVPPKNRRGFQHWSDGSHVQHPVCWFRLTYKMRASILGIMSILTEARPVWFPSRRHPGRRWKTGGSPGGGKPSWEKEPFRCREGAGMQWLQGGWDERTRREA